MICTLGNFATKLLSGSQEGITKLHGRPQSREIGGRTVLLYPIFHPAAALRAEPVLGLLREDFARLPGLLAGEVAKARPEEAPALAPSLRERGDTAGGASGGAAGRAADQLDLFG